MVEAMSPVNQPAEDTSLRRQVYDSLREALTAGRFVPGQKLTFRFVAGALGVSLTPVREALRRLVAEGAFEMQPNRSVRVPLMTRAKILELRDIRMALEGLAAEKAADRARPAAGRRLAPDRARDRRRAQPRRQRDRPPEGPRVPFRPLRHRRPADPAARDRGPWLQTGPYMNLLYPDFISLAARTGDAGAHHPGPAGARCGCGAARN